MLARKHEGELKEYISQKKQALLVDGARQVGKTFLIRKISEETGRPFFEFNLIEQQEVCTLFDGAKDASDFIQKLQLIAGKAIPESSILFFDEIQEADDALTLMKFLIDENKYTYVFSGSLLGIELNSFRSAPVGYLHETTMYPLDFEEFLMALGGHADTWNQIIECFEKKEPVDGFIHDKLIDLFHLYLIIGGMPQAVQSYVETHDLSDVSVVHKDIVNLYKRDFTKYEKEKRLKLVTIYDLIPSELNMQNKRFVFSDLDKHFKFDRYENSFLWLKDAGVAIPVYGVAETTVPFLQSKTSNLFKLFMNDVGLLTSYYSDEVKLKILNHEKDINYGAMFENAVAVLLESAGTTPYYYKDSKLGEVDFIVECDGACIPIEVKSGKKYRSHRALNHIMQREEPYISKAIVLSNSNVEVDERIAYLPIYMAGLIRNSKLKNSHIQIDMTGL